MLRSKGTIMLDGRQ
uniref:Uncharacterized protein n=1 Tax=Arundo donax TaxID=35708 RepID=A0A0A9T5T3_ARUDO